MGLNALSIARIQASVQDRNVASRPYSVHWTENQDLQGWTSFFNLDIVGAWNGFLFATKRTVSGGSIGPSDDFPPVDTNVNDRIFFRLRYDKHPKNKNPTSFGKIQWTTTADPTFNDEKSLRFTIFPDTGFRIYELDMNRSRTWTGLVENIRFFPCEDGAINDEFFLSFFEIGTTEFDFQLDNPRAGLSAKLVGGQSLTSDITITKDVNDRLAVNIDGYGFVEVRLTPQTASPTVIARDLSIQLSKIAIGGYMRASATIDLDSKKLTIESGTRAANSSVTIQSGTNSAAFVLGLTNVDGDFIGTLESGADPASDFISISDYRPTTFELLNFLDNSSDSVAFVVDPEVKVLEGGRRDYGTVTKALNTELVLEGRSSEPLQGSVTTVSGSVGEKGVTFIDVNHPFTDDGLLRTVSFNGLTEEAGGSKWKVFRPRKDGDLTLVAEGEIGKKQITENPSGGLVLTTDPGAFSEDVSGQGVRVRRGDLLGIFNVSMHLGTGRLEKPDARYYSIAGDVQGTFTPPVPTGAGDSGIPVYAVGESTRKQLVLDIDFRKRVNLDTITLVGEEETNDLEYNVATATSASFSADVEGEHTVCRDVIVGEACFERTNAAFNLQALNDGLVFADNGISSFGDPGPTGLGGATVDGATYFYANGDAEFIEKFEFPGARPQSFGFDRDPLGITCFFSSSTPRLDKPIDRAVLYFKDPKNMRSWQIETALGQGSSGGNGSINGFQLVPEESISAIQFDDKRVDRNEFVFTQKTTATQNLLLGNPVILDVIAKDGTRNPQKGVDFQFSAAELGGVNFAEQATFLNTQWTKFQWEFDPIRTTGFRWFTDFHLSTKISEFEIYASAPAIESIADNVQVLFSADGESFATAEVLAAEGESATFQIGNSPRFMRLIFRPTRTFSAKNLTFQFEQDQICFGEEGRILGSTPVAEARIGAPGAVKRIPVKNNTGVTADLLVDIPVDAAPSRELLYFSHLTSADDLEDPSVGGTARVSFDPDKTLVETENVAINAQAYGLKNLTTLAPLVTFTSELLTNGDFETGDLTGWNLIVTESGAETFQQPRVYDIATPGSQDFDPSVFSQDGSFLFGFSIDDRVTTQAGQQTPIVFTLESEVIDVSTFASSIDVGGAEISMAFKFAAAFAPEDVSPKLNILGAPIEAGVALPLGSVISTDYGTNTLKSQFLGQSNRALIDTSSDILDVEDLTARLKENTRFIKFQFEVIASGVRTLSGFDVQKFFLDSVAAKLRLPNTAAVKWYKSYQDGDGDFTDASFRAVTEFTKTVGSDHWWQPFSADADGGTPLAGQTQGFSNVFANDRFLGIQSFKRMTLSDPGIIAAQWSGEKTLTGFRIGLSHFSSVNHAWPRSWNVQVLKTQAELSEDPDITKDSHFRTIKNYTQTGPWTGPGSDLLNSNNADFSGAPNTIITTWLFDEPVETEGIRIIFKTNCDKFEKDLFGASALTGTALTNFTTATTCPPNVGSSFTSNFGLSLTFFQPLESVGRTLLPLDNVRSQVNGGETPASFVYAALDLRRVHALDLDTDLFELIVDSFNQTDWPSTSPVFSDTETDDPNAVVWGNTSAQRARWVRFRSVVSEKFEDSTTLFEGPTTASIAAVIRIPQSIIRSARIYPDITVQSIHTIGFNAQWNSLGERLTDNSGLTFVQGSDYPVIALDLQDAFFLEASNDEFLPIHDLDARTRLSTADDKLLWDADDNDNFTYSAGSFRRIDDPQKVKFLDFGTTAPATPVRWVAFKVATNLLLSSLPSEVPRQYAFNVPGGQLFGSFWRPAVQEKITAHPTWFRTKQTGLADVSTFNTEFGNIFSAEEGIDFGANVTSLGSAFFPFDGQFSLLDRDTWTVLVRDLNGFTDPDFDFPHQIFRVFRDPFSLQLQQKTVVAFKIRGLSADFYPKSFRLQRLRSSVESSVTTTVDPDQVASTITLLGKNTSWADVFGAEFTDVDTFQAGDGFIATLLEPVQAAGFRLVITDSEYPDDSVATEVNELGGFATFLDISGPQTRVAELVFYEESLLEQQLAGILEINHANLASISATSETPAHPASNVNDDRLSTYWQSTGFAETLTIDLVGVRPISRFEWEKDPALGQVSGRLSTNAPSDFTLQAEIAGQGLVTVLSETGFIGNSFSKNLAGGPINSNRFVFEITAVQGENERANSVQLSELRLIEEASQSTPLVEVDRIFESPTNNETSTRISYAENTDAEAVVVIDGMDAGSDALFSERDFYELNLKINDINLFNTQFGYIKLGNNAEAAYRWDFKDLSGLQTGWNTLRLQFKTASDRATVPFQTGSNFALDTDESGVDFTTPDATFTRAADGVVSQHVIQAPGIRFFEIKFRGTKNVPDKKLELALNGFKFARNRFDDVCRFGKSLYLNNSEVLPLSIENIDISQGTVDFWFQPDWDSAGIVLSRQRFIPSLFRVIQPDGKFLNFFYRPSTGFVLLIFDGFRVRQFETALELHPFDRYETFHLGVVWDAKARIGSERSSVQISFNGRVVLGSNVVWDADRQGRGNFIVGGESSQTLVANPFNATALTFTTVPTLPARHTASCWGLMENLKVYNYPKVDFKDKDTFEVERTNLVTANELVEVSLNGVDFEGIGSAALPLTVNGVVPEGEANIYVRTNIPKGLTGNESRDASLLVTWRSPLIPKCD